MQSRILFRYTVARCDTDRSRWSVLTTAITDAPIESRVEATGLSYMDAIDARNRLNTALTAAEA